MGVGAGYTIEVQNCKFTSVTSLTITAVSDELLSIDCQATIVGDVKGKSYYYGCPWVSDVTMNVTHMNLNYAELFDGNGYNVDSWMLTPEASNRIVNELRSDYDIEDIEDVNLYNDDFRSKLTVNDFNLDAIKQSLLKSYFDFSGESRLGGGWTHETFTGEFTVSVERPYADETYTLQIPDTFIVNYLDRAITGDNVIYDVVFNGEVIETTDTEDDAVSILKSEINAAIAEGGPEAVDFSDCYVEQGYDIMLNGIGEADVDFDYPYLVYNADGDSDYDEYL